MTPANKTFSQAEFGAAVGISRQAVNAHLKLTGAKPETVSAFVLGYCEHLRKIAAGHRSEAGDLDLTAERAQLAQVQRQKIELDLAERRGELVEFDKIAEVYCTAVDRARDKMLSIPTRGAPLVFNAKKLAEVEEILETLIYEALTELSQQGVMNENEPRSIEDPS